MELISDIRLGLRTLRKSPALAAVSILALTFGIGLTTMMFSIVYGALLRGLPFEGGDRVVVAHGGVLDILYRAATRMDLQAPRTWTLANASINRVLWSPEGPSLVGWGDVSHLQDPESAQSLDERLA